MPGTDPKASGGGTPTPSGTTEPNDPNNSVKNESVSRESYEKSVTSEKNAKARANAAEQELNEIKVKQKAEADAKLKEQGKFKELVEQKDKEITQLKGENSSIKTTVQDGQKLNSFLETVNGNVDKKFWNLIPLDQIKTNEDGSVDAASVTEATKNFTEKYGRECISKPGTSVLPNEAPNGDPIGLTVEQWKQLPSKEMIKRRKEVIRT